MFISKHASRESPLQKEEEPSAVRTRCTSHHNHINNKYTQSFTRKCILTRFVSKMWRRAGYNASYTHLPSWPQRARPALPPWPRGQLHSVLARHDSFREQPKYNTHYDYSSPQAAEPPWEEERGNAHVMKRVQGESWRRRRRGVLSWRLSLGSTPLVRVREVESGANSGGNCSPWFTGCSHVDSHLFPLWATATSCFYRESLAEHKKPGFSSCSCLSLCAEITPAGINWMQVFAPSHCQINNMHNLTTQGVLNIMMYTWLPLLAWFVICHTQKAPTVMN